MTDKLHKIYKDHKEMVMYALFGVVTFFVSVLSFALFTKLMGLDALIANVFSWILAVMTAYITNKKWVFLSVTEGKRDLMKECMEFFGGRFFTLLVEELMLFVFVTMMQIDAMFIKIIAQVIVVILNYLISKLIVFKN